MPSKSQSRYPLNWSHIALEVKQSVGWRCSKCGLSKTNKSAKKLKVTLAPEHSSGVVLCNFCKVLG